MAANRPTYASLAQLNAVIKDVTALKLETAEAKAAAQAAAQTASTANTTASDAAEATADLAANGILFMPAIVPENGPAVMTLSRNVRLFTSYAKEPYTLIWDPKELYVGWTIAGCVAGAGTVTFMAAPGTTVTLRDVSGAIIPMGQPAVFQGGYGFMVCTEKTETSLTIQTVLGSLGVQSLHVITDLETGQVVSQPGSINVMSYTQSHMEYVFDPTLYEPRGYERRFLQAGAGTLTLKGKEGTSVTFLNRMGETQNQVVLEQGEVLKVLCISQSAGAATLQILPYRA